MRNKEGGADGLSALMVAGGLSFFLPCALYFFTRKWVYPVVCGLAYMCLLTYWRVMLGAFSLTCFSGAFVFLILIMMASRVNRAGPTKAR